MAGDGKHRWKLPMANPNICEGSNLAIVHQSVKHPDIKVAFDSASIDLLNLVNASIHGEEIDEKARLGVMLLEEGQKKVNDGKHRLFSAIGEIPKRIK